MGKTEKKTEGWGSRLGYILSTLGMAVGVGAMWRFPTMCAQYGGGAFLVAFIIITMVAVIPAGWAESALGRKYKMSAVGIFGKLTGKKGKVFGFICGATPWCLLFYYPIIMATILIYIFYTITGSSFLGQEVAFYNSVNANKPVVYAVFAFIILLTMGISLRGIQNGIEKICKILLPIVFIILVIIDVRIFTIPGISEGIRYYMDPDWAQLANPKLWAAAAGMALFAVGLGPGFLLTYGMYLSDDADLATDFLSVNVIQLVICVLCGFAIIPAVVLFGLDPLAGKGLLFMSLPMVFSKLSGGMIWFFLFLVALFFAGLSTTIAQMELPVVCLMDCFHLTRKKAIAIVTVVILLGGIPCVWSDTFFAFFDNLMGNAFYCVEAAVLAFYLAWIIGAKKVRTEWYNPTSKIKWGSWVDILYKFIAVPMLIYFALESVRSLF